VIDHVRERNLNPVAVLLTHAHVDHIAGVGDIVRAFRSPRLLPVLVHELEKEWLSNPMLNLSGWRASTSPAPGPDGFLADGQRLELGGSSWAVIHTPGHSPGGVTFWHEPSNRAIVGDTLFAGSVGRTDFPGSDPRQLTRSIKERLYVLPDQTVV
jgi:glyoxylase-like metal-dependent hydrolase (beta-lactamase superfamily II)